MKKKKLNQLSKFDKILIGTKESRLKYKETYQKFCEKAAFVKKKYGLEDLYFSKLIHIRTLGNGLTEVYYQITDLYLIYLAVNEKLPKDLFCEIPTCIIKEQFLYNDSQGELFSNSIWEAVEQQKPTHNLDKGDGKLLEGLTEKIKIVTDRNDPRIKVIKEREPLTYDDLIEKK